MTEEESVREHYDNTALYDSIEEGLRMLGVDLDAVTSNDLSSVDEFHIGGTAATEMIITHLGLGPGKKMLDLGCGIGGPARLIANRTGCQVEGIDLTPTYVTVGTQLNDLVRMGQKVKLICGSVLDIPGPDERYDAATLIHVGMNIDKKHELMAEAYRVLKPGGTFVVFDVIQIGNAVIEYPLPWSENAQNSALASKQVYLDAISHAGFKLSKCEVLQNMATLFFDRMRTENRDGPSPLGLHLLMGENTQAKIMNMGRQVKEGRISPMLIVCVK